MNLLECLEFYFYIINKFNSFYKETLDKMQDRIELA